MLADAKGNGPPSEVAPSELWAALTAIPMPHEVVDFPVKDPVLGKSIGKVAIVPLCPEDQMVCQKMAGEFARKFTGETPKDGEESPAYKKIFGDEAAVQILWRALRDPNDKTLAKNAFAAPSLIRRPPFTPDLVSVLLRMYLRTCATHGPLIATMSKEEMDAWLDALEAGGSAFPFELLTSAMSSELLMHSVARSKALRTANGSAGQPQDGTSLGAEDNSPPRTQPADSPPSVDDADVIAELPVDVIAIPKAE